MRKLNAPIDVILLDPSSNPKSESALSASCLEYDPSMPNKFLVGTRQGEYSSFVLIAFHLKLNWLPIFRYCDELQQKSKNNSRENNVSIRGTFGSSSRSASPPPNAENIFDCWRLDYECLDWRYSGFTHFNFKVCPFQELLTTRFKPNLFRNLLIGIKMSSYWQELGVTLDRPSYSLPQQTVRFTCGIF